MEITILIPVKDLADAKTRMSPLLSSRERVMIARAMFEDVARALAPLPSPVAVITSSAAAAEKARGLGWRIMEEPWQTSESESVDSACVRLYREGIRAVLRLPADLPLLRTEDVSGMIEPCLESPAVVIAPSRDGTGTNALLRTPPDLFPSRFGPGSFALHLEEARRAGARIRIVENERIALDLDDASDILHFMASPTHTETWRILAALDVEKRIQEHART